MEYQFLVSRAVRWKLILFWWIDESSEKMQLKLFFIAKAIRTPELEVIQQTVAPNLNSV